MQGQELRPHSVRFEITLAAPGINIITLDDGCKSIPLCVQGFHCQFAQGSEHQERVLYKHILRAQLPYSVFIFCDLMCGRPEDMFE
jgi:hypothetical protein